MNALIKGVFWLVMRVHNQRIIIVRHGIIMCCVAVVHHAVTDALCALASRPRHRGFNSRCVLHSPFIAAFRNAISAPGGRVPHFMGKEPQNGVNNESIKSVC